MTTAQDIIKTLGLTPHPEEGGFFAETYRSAESFCGKILPDRYGDSRHHSTAIYYLLTPETCSHLHRLESDEVFHFYMGDPCEMLRLYPDGSGETVLLGTDLAAGQRPQTMVPRGVWQGMRLLPGGTFALMGCTVAPGFDYRDYTHGSRSKLLEQYPGFAEQIRLLTQA
ncbi:cupin domain-containing protein [Pseudodesulfovibrio sp.]|uniref:cupin domain-containing protein n=1 Tax=unclassified Pseudodesulfovibrio TaxID=2661612 RepID=UPI003B00D78C